MLVWHYQVGIEERPMKLLRGALRRMIPAAILAATCSTAAAQSADAMQALAAKAAQAEPVVWYESSPESQIVEVLKAFNARYPDVKVKYVRMVGGNELASRAIQEVQARGHTADLLTGGPDHLWQLNQRGLLRDLSQDNLGLPSQLLPVNYAVPTTASVYVLLWNSRKVADDQAPRNWDEVINEKWTGRMGSWVRAAAFAQLASAWGEDKAKSSLDNFVKLKPYLFKSTFPLAQGVASGEVDVAVGFYHSAQPVFDAGAPVKYRMLDPTPMHTISSSVSKSARNPSGATLLMLWLATPEGAEVYEKATSRGNPLVSSTKTYQMLQGVKVAEWPFDDVEKLATLNEQYNAILAKARPAM
ncbi:hypothetical protein CAL18_13800 [Bordetella genomosp. 7]|nr:hypothetical protein CAL18_13800 [Bordetella genomosp. 7]